MTGRYPPIHVFGGTSDARLICQLLDTAGERYSLSVASDAGLQLAGDIRGEVVVGRMDTVAMVDFLITRQVQWVIDASHPYAELLSDNVVAACRQAFVPLTRYARPSEIEVLSHPLLHKVDSVTAACAVAQKLGERILLTTGSKQLAEYQQGLTGKTLLVRVLPTADVLSQCEALGLGVGNIIALRGPFSAQFNQALYEFCQPDVVITKESGAQGGYQEKVAPCLALNLPCIVVRRPASVVLDNIGQQVTSLDEFAQHLTRWQQQRGQ
ncbi:MULTISPECIES: cobalt-precorrin-6A reductase [Yersinia]|uniref:cobalt-precorrin-6A reductase n=1 Tax=Yersinia TaxID=629 RepID=UPI0005DB189F|nr:MULTISPECIES: cobalt-precorrin-6A reductase [Yersinia]OVZ99219.1 cobalt-precorrin-6A reductase [Yersinia frederiksenii]RXA97705.1 cobalt-precorrin-6A reductase [Yersinia sp. 2105 StPb PI]CNI33978.1 cobalt-precorrin-6x reductase [Yersinia frederiksenii]CNI94598.1 cobalt-precorrin-6x reductase [Yersinia frederiksenii]CNK23269.1 cobalt-precorrin-6x reductase [Yersinia frederiksenii]